MERGVVIRGVWLLERGVVIHFVGLRPYPPRVIFCPFLIIITVNTPNPMETGLFDAMVSARPFYFSLNKCVYPGISLITYSALTPCSVLPCQSVWLSINPPYLKALEGGINGRMRRGQPVRADLMGCQSVI